MRAEKLLILILEAVLRVHVSVMSVEVVFEFEVVISGAFTQQILPSPCGSRIDGRLFVGFQQAQKSFSVALKYLAG